MLADKSHAKWIPCCLAGRGCHWVASISSCCCRGSSHRLRHTKGLRVVRNIILFASWHLGLLWCTALVDLWSSVWAPYQQISPRTWDLYSLSWTMRKPAVVISCLYLPKSWGWRQYWMPNFVTRMLGSELHFLWCVVRTVNCWAIFPDPSLFYWWFACLSNLSLC